MFVRVASITATAMPEQGAAFFRERMLPDLRSYDGFQDAMLLTSDDGGPSLVMSFWDTEENLLNAEAAPAPHRASAAKAALGADTQRDVSHLSARVPSVRRLTTRLGQCSGVTP
jgi:heme-degrading monooxygenase HmoA